MSFRTEISILTALVVLTVVLAPQLEGASLAALLH
jgi:hypothetical protein